MHLIAQLNKKASFKLSSLSLFTPLPLSLSSSRNLDVREKLNFFRRQTDVALISKAMQLKEAEKLLKTSKPDKDQVLRWGNSFDALLTDKCK